MVVENNKSKATLMDILEECPVNEIIGDNLVRAWAKINSPKYERIMCSVSGGADSDIVVDICTKCDKDKKIDYIWFDTGLEYQATKDHLEYLEQKYEIIIKTEKAIKVIPASCKQYGQPFLSKQVSEWIERLQRHNFSWEDRPFDELYKEYPKCKAALQWWCNEKGEDSRFNISNNKWLKEYMVNNPPSFPISNKCCNGAKKDVLHKVTSEGEYDLSINGMRKSEGGARSTAYKSCFSENDNGCDFYMPLWWYLNETKEIYRQHYNVIYSRCYSEYGLKRTGCAGCPFGRDFEFELEVIRKYEPKLYAAVNNIFGESYDYTRMYRIFFKMMDEREKQNKRRFT